MGEAAAQIDHMENRATMGVERAVRAAERAADIVSAVVTEGDLARLSPAQRVQYYSRVCESLGLNPLTKPFDYINLNGKLTLYAKRDATDQLRRLHSISIAITGRERMDDLYVVTARATSGEGRSDEAVGAVSLGGLKGEALANAIMKAETKAKRRVTLGIIGLGWLDETEVGSVADARVARVDMETGEVLPAAHVATPAPRAIEPTAKARTTTAKRQTSPAAPQAPAAGRVPLDSPTDPETAAQDPLSAPRARRAPAVAMCTAAQREALFASARQAGVADADLRAIIAHRHQIESTKALTADQAGALITDLQAVAQRRLGLDDLLPPQGGDDEPAAAGYVVPQETLDELRGLARDAGISAEELRDTWLARCVDVESTAAVVAELRADAVPF